MAAAILLPLATLAISTFGPKLKEKDYSQAKLIIKEVLNAQQESFRQLGVKIENVVAQNALSAEAIQIQSWGGDQLECLEQAEKGHTEGLEELYEAIGSTTVGIKRRLRTIDAILTGSASEYGNRGTILLYMDSLYDKLKSLDDVNYTISSYLSDLGKFLKYHMDLQKTGMVLRISAAQSYDDKTLWETKLTETLQCQLKYAYDNLPPMIRKMKPDMTSPMDSKHWWRFKAILYTTPMKSTTERALTGDPVPVPVIGAVLTEVSTGPSQAVDVSKKGPCPETEWRFAPSMDSDGKTNVQSRSLQDHYIGVTWVLFGKRGLVTDDESKMNGKIVPEKTGMEPKFKLVPGKKDVVDIWPYGSDFILDDEGVGQEA